MIVLARHDGDLISVDDGLDKFVDSIGLIVVDLHHLSAQLGLLLHMPILLSPRQHVGFQKSGFEVGNYFAIDLLLCDFSEYFNLLPASKTVLSHAMSVNVNLVVRQT